MDVNFIKKLFDPGTSNEERDLLCEITYGKSFKDSLDDIRREDFAAGLNSGKYKILSIGPYCGINTNTIEMNFICTKYGLFELPENFLYEHEETTFDCPPAHNLFAAVRRDPPKYWVKFHTAEIDDEMICALRRWADEYGISFDGILNIVKGQKSENGNKKKKTRRKSGAGSRRKADPARGQSCARSEERRRNA